MIASEGGQLPASSQKPHEKESLRISLKALFYCRRCLVQVSYAIGVAEPLSITIFDYGTSHKTHKELLEIVKKNFDLRPGMIVRELNLRDPIYQKTSSYGHFGRAIFPWEQPKKLV